MKPIDITALISKNSIKYTTSILFSFVGIAGLAISHHSYAEDYDLEVVIEKKGEVDESQIAFVPFSGDRNFSDMVYSNLDSMPIPITSQGLIGQPHTREDLAATLPAWQQFGIPYLVIGNVKSDLSNTVVNFEVVEVANGRIIKGKQTLSGSNKSSLANKVAGRVYELIANQKLDLNARLLYIEEKGAGPSKTSSLILRNSDGSNSRVLTRVTDASILSPAVSPDGRYIAYSVQLKNHNANLYKYDLLSQKITPLVESKGADLSPSFSPDGSTILFSSTLDGDADIYRVSSMGGKAELIINKPFDQVTPSYAPNGSFVFASDHAEPNNPSIYRYNFSNPISRITHGGYATNPSYSNDGSKIAYLSGVNAAVMDSNGKLIRNFGRTGLDQAPSLSPSGLRLAYSQGNKRSNIIIRYLAGGKPISLTTEGEVKSVIWVPSGDFR